MSSPWSTVATFHDPVAAAMARNYLDSQGIPALLLDEATIATDWMLAGAIGGIKLQVSPFHVERAELLLAQIQESRDEPDEVPATAVASAEIAEELQAEREDKAEINQLVERLFRATVLGWILWPLHFYTLFLLVQLMQSEGTVSDNRRWKVWIAIVLNIPIAVLVMLMLGLTWGLFISR